MKKLNIGMSAFGTDGDILPFIKLGLDLFEGGHNVELTIINIREKDYTYLSNNNGFIINQVQYPVNKLKDNFNSNDFWNFTNEEFHHYFDTQFKLIRPSLKRISQKLVKNKDIIIGSRQLYPLRFITEKQGIPYVTLFMEHIFVRSKYYAPIGNDEGDWVSNIEKWDESEKFLSVYFLPEINEYRKTLSLTPLSNYTEEVLYSNELNLVSFSESLLPTKNDWGGNFKNIGYLPSIINDTQYSITEELGQFLSHGKEPILITLGSLVIYEDDLNSFYNIFENVIRKLGERAIIITPTLEGKTSDNNIFYLDGFVDYNTILSHCDCAIHHCGVGTMNSVVSSGKPSIVLAYGFDQFKNANLLLNKGVCNSVLSRKDLTEENLEQAIINTKRAISLYSNSLNLSKKIKIENQLINAVQIIEEKFLLQEN